MLIVANWKSYVEDREKAKKLVATSKKIARTSVHTIVLAPPSAFLGVLALKNASKVLFSSQDVSATTGGAATGEVTATMCVTAGATYAIVGHSERRAMGDTNEVVALKIAHALAQNLIPILCVGEHERDRDGQYLSFIREEITTALAPLTAKERARVIIAYEPLWAIGKTAENAISPSALAEMVLYIRKVLAEFLPGKNALHAVILYGGSVTPDDILALAGHSGINGVLIGHASVDALTFTELVHRVS